MLFLGDIARGHLRFYETNQRQRSGRMTRAPAAVNECDRERQKARIPERASDCRAAARSGTTHSPPDDDAAPRADPAAPKMSQVGTAYGVATRDEATTVSDWNVRPVLRLQIAGACPRRPRRPRSCFSKRAMLALNLPQRRLRWSAAVISRRA